MRAVAAGDHGALALLVERHGASVRRFARAAMGDEAGGDDVLQDTFVAAWRSAASFRGEGSSRGWLISIARNAAHRRRRRRVGEPAHEASLEELAESAGWGAADPSPSFEAVLADRELLGHAFAALGSADQEVLTLIELEGMGLQEAAEALGLEVNAGKSRLRRARLRLLRSTKEVSDAR